MVETADKYDAIIEKVDEDLSWERKQDLIGVIRKIDEAKIETVQDDYCVRVHIIVYNLKIILYLDTLLDRCHLPRSHS